MFVLKGKKIVKLNARHYMQGLQTGPCVGRIWLTKGLQGTVSHLYEELLVLHRTFQMI